MRQQEKEQSFSLSHQQNNSIDPERLLRQEKLREFTERTQRERANGRWIQRNHSARTFVKKAFDDLNDFKRQYEDKHGSLPKNW